MLSKPESNLLPVFSLLISATMWGLLWYPLRLFEQQGLNGVWVSLVAFLAATLAGLLLFRHLLHELARRPLLLLALALASGWLNISFIVAVLEGNVVRAVMLFYLSPLWTVLLGRLFLGERLDLFAVLVLLFAMAGAMTMLWDPAIGMPWPQSRADWLAISSGFAFSVSNVLVRGLQDISIQMKALSNWMGVLVIACLWIYLSHGQFPQTGTHTLLWCIALGVFGFTTMTLTVQYGVTHMPVYRSAIILLFEVVVATVSTQLLTDEVIMVWEWLGGGLIILAAMTSAYGQMRGGDPLESEIV